jgi:NAD(P)-dependent dehydrogenase (short-subunit alcohol dehydrogenase family)
MKKNILITGASGNLGRVAAETFATQGNHVIAMTTPGKGLGYDVAGAITTYEADLSDEKSVNETLAKIIDTHKTIDAAVLTVGGFNVGNIQTTGAELLQKMISVNFNTAYFVARPVFNQMMLQSFGRIIFIGARPGLVASEGKNMIAYALSKSMVFKLAELLNAESVGKNVVAAVVVPGTIDTPANRQSNPQADYTNWVSPAEITANIAFLLSDDTRALRDPVVKLYSNS